MMEEEEEEDLLTTHLLPGGCGRPLPLVQGHGLLAEALRCPAPYHTMPEQAR